MHAHTSRKPRAGLWKSSIWFALLVASVCFEGLGRKLLPDVPSAIFYYLKDVVLLAGLALFGVSSQSLLSTGRLLRGFIPLLLLATLWTIFEAFNPAHPSLVLALVGLRSYWLWWIAPLVIATALRGAHRERAVLTLTAAALIVAAYAALQFASPADSPINAYALYRGEQIMDVAKVATTGRARVSSTFSYLSGFSDFVTLVPPVLLGFGMYLKSRRRRWLSVATVGACIGAIPLSGSRGPLLLAMLGLSLLAMYAGILRGRASRRIAVGLAIAGALAFMSTPEAVQGIADRFGGDDTRSRLWEAAEVLPPVALAIHEYPFLGEGTGTQQNARLAFGVSSNWVTESETSRLLVELGAGGYLLVWASKVALAVALIRAARKLKRSGAPGVAGTALALSVYAIAGNSAFDHVWQALFFIGAGLVLAAVTDVQIAERGMSQVVLRERVVARNSA